MGNEGENGDFCNSVNNKNKVKKRNAHKKGTYMSSKKFHLFEVKLLLFI